MASSYDVFFEGPHGESRQLVERTLTDHGFTLSIAPDGSTRAVRGTLVSTLALRAFAGRTQLLTLDVQWFVDDHARLVARIVHASSTAVLGGPVGVVRAQRAVGGLVRSLEELAAARRAAVLGAAAPSATAPGATAPGAAAPEAEAPGPATPRES